MKSINQETIAALQASSDAVGGLVVLSGLGAWGGMWLDQKFHCAPLWVTALALLGMCLGLARIIVKANAADKALAQKRSGGPGQPERKGYRRFDDDEDD